MAECFEFDFVEEPSRDFFCPVTLDLLREPHQTLCCGNHISLEAAATLQKLGQPCPLCKEANLNTVPDKFFKRKVNAVRIKCVHHDDGCAWAGELVSLQRHLNSGSVEGECKFKEVVCPYSCGLEFRRCEATEHMSSECPQRPFQCQYCGHDGTHSEIIANHYLRCEKYPIECPNECGAVFEQSNVLHHLETCPLEVIECEFSHVGCTAEMQRSAMEDHTRQSVEEHLSMACKTIEDMKLQMTTVFPLLEQMRELTLQLGTRVATLELPDRPAHLSLKQLDSRAHSSLKQLGSPAHPSLEQLSSSLTHDDLYFPISEISGGKAGSPTHTSPDNVHVPKSTDEKNSEYIPLPKKPSNHASSLPVPPLLLVMTEFEHHRASSNNWYSLPFYTHACGYKLCLRVDANASTEEEHISAYVFLMRGEYDSKLSWPFRGVVTVHLVNQRTDGDHIKWSATFLVSSEAAERVMSGERAKRGIGRRQLVLHSDLCYNPALPWNTEYLKSDCLKFWITSVHFGND